MDNGMDVSSPTAYLALDTNVLLNHLGPIQRAYARMLASDVWLLIPTTVVNELDGLKVSDKPTPTGTLGEIARKATSWLLSILQRQRSGGAGRVRFEKWSEAAQSLPAGPRPDDAVLACCLYFAQSSRVSLWTDDRNLALLAEANGIPTIGREGVFPTLGLARDESEVEAMEVDGDINDNDKHDLPLFTRRRRNSIYARSNDSEHTPLPPPGALAEALAASKAAALGLAYLSTGRALAPELAAGLVEILGGASRWLETCAGPPSAAGDAGVQVTTLAYQLSTLFTTDHGPEITRSLARCVDASRTLKAWLGPEPAPGSGQQRVRSAQAAEAVSTLAEEMEKLGFVLDRTPWEDVSERIRSLES